MNKSKVMKVLIAYNNFFRNKGLKEIDYPHDKLLKSKEDGLSHCSGMIGKIFTFMEENKMRKTFRWLGFIQGVLWALGFYTLDELMNHSRPTEKELIRVECCLIRMVMFRLEDTSPSAMVIVSGVTEEEAEELGRRELTPYFLDYPYQLGSESLGTILASPEPEVLFLYSKEKGIIG